MFGKTNRNQCGNGNGNRRGMNGNGNHGGRNHGGAFGEGGFCVCSKCGAKIAHERGVKCTTQKCPSCGHTLVREELLHAKESVIQA
ncbi:hypothetical protein [Sulfurospirillum multivorans]|uniref:Arginine-rich iron-sulfur binding protein n=2 Tax=Sulfurospirillum multivorans TaxID=66821 RepID=A0AA86DZV6_SULMK|nr:hypothetical protein [Sulfurospirillum multivorans]AHJ12930.1 arginine-rich iron-sulfur binding protein [Sulfurospirillum multivorans DSM 12446]QEH06420.1 arginine-rich iron-sulfur binding protein [Sulfurospirillum multivorans]